MGRVGIKLIKRDNVSIKSYVVGIYQNRHNIYPHYMAWWRTGGKIITQETVLFHYDNMPIQYTANFNGCNNKHFQLIFFSYYQNIDCGYTLEPPQ